MTALAYAGAAPITRASSGRASDAGPPAAPPPPPAALGTLTPDRAVVIVDGSSSRQAVLRVRATRPRTRAPVRDSP